MDIEKMSAREKLSLAFEIYNEGDLEHDCHLSQDGSCEICEFVFQTKSEFSKYNITPKYENDRTINTNKAI